MINYLYLKYKYTKNYEIYRIKRCTYCICIIYRDEVTYRMSYHRKCYIKDIFVHIKPFLQLF